MTNKRVQDKRLQDTHETVVRLNNCTAGEQIRLTYELPASGRLYSVGNFKHRHSISNPALYHRGTAIDVLHEEFTILADGDWYVVVECEDDGKTLTSVDIERIPQDPILWNESHKDMKIVRKQPTPYDAPMASTLGYWERKTDIGFECIKICLACYSFVKREDVRCALVTIPGELPRVDYVIPVCKHCYDKDKVTLLATPQMLAKAPKP